MLRRPVIRTTRWPCSPTCSPPPTRACGSLCRAIAARLVLDRSRVGRATRSGVSHPRSVPASFGGELDIDSSMEAISVAHAEKCPPSLDELVARDWGQRDLALCVVVDHSGSMNGARLAAAAAVTAAACALRAPEEHAVLAFAGSVRVIKPLSSQLSRATTVERVLRLRGHGVTGLAAALRAAVEQLAVARAQRRVVILLSDCRGGATRLRQRRAVRRDVGSQQRTGASRQPLEVSPCPGRRPASPVR